jgi:hypothetical protein
LTQSSAQTNRNQHLTIFAHSYFLTFIKPHQHCQNGNFVIKKINPTKLFIQKMRTSNLHFLIITLACILFACKDNNDIEPDANDAFVGSQRLITLSSEMDKFSGTDFECVIKAEDGTIFRRRGNHMRSGNTSLLTLDTGLRTGTYRLLALEVPTIENGTDTVWTDYGLGCRVRISAENHSATVLDTFNSEFELVGDGSETNPFIISSAEHLWRLRDFTNSDENNTKLTGKTHFRQECDLRMRDICTSSDRKFGWLPIGSIPENPFRGIYDGNGYKITGLWIHRPNSPGIGLFGFIDQAKISNLTVQNPDIEGNYAVGALVGGTSAPGDKRGSSALHGCTVEGGSVSAPTGSVAVGGLIGVVDRKGFLSVDSCYNNNTRVSGDYAVGGLVGAGTLYSTINALACNNHGRITAHYSGAGGIVGSVDSLFVSGCRNMSAITGGTAVMSGTTDNGGIGAGGIAGGTGVAFIYSSFNEGKIEGAIGVGGIIGSTRIGKAGGNLGGELLYNNVLAKDCGNVAAVSGRTSVGGICGEAQFGGYEVVNTGAVSATDNQSTLGGIVGNTSIAVIYNVVNQGTVTAAKAESAGGIVGKTSFGALFGCQNFGTLNITSTYTGGIAGWVGNYTVANYCFNGGTINDSGNRSTGGIIGEAGDAREWTGMDIAGCVVGAAEIVMGIAGPAISVIGKTLTDGVMKGSKAFEGFLHVLHIGEATIDWSLLAYDQIVYGIGIYGIITEKELDEMQTNLEATAGGISSEVKSRIQAIQAGYTVDTASLPPGIDGSTISSYINNHNTVMKFFEASDNNNSTVYYNMNRTREDRVKHIESQREVTEIITKSIAGACIAVGTVAAVVSAFATGGSTLAIAAGIIGPVATVIGGANAIFECATNFTVNAIVVKQCTNVGTVNAPSADYPAGIIGYMQQYCMATDCLNAGKFGPTNKKHSGGITSYASAESVVERNVSIGTNWHSPIVASSKSSFSHDDNIYYIGSSFDIYGGYETGATLDDLHNKAFFKVLLNTDGAMPLWQVADKQGSFPIPYHSEMETPMN